MKNKLLFVGILAIVFVASKIVFANTVVVDPGKMGMTMGLGALVIGYFARRIIKDGIFKAEEKA